MIPSLRSRLILACLVALAGCSEPPPTPTYADLRYTGEPPIRLDAASLEVREDYHPPFRSPNVDHLFPVPPMRALENWAHDRLKPTGNAGRIVFIVRNASVTETELPKQEGLSATFTKQPAERYDLAIQATVQIVDAQGLPVRVANVQTSRSQSVLEGITPNDRDRAWYDMTKAAMADFDKQMDSEIRNNFGIYYDQ